MTDLFPYLKGLPGGKKQEWINSNLDFIAMLNDIVGFEETRKLLYMKPGTLVSALKRAEGQHRPAVTRADKAYNVAQQANNNSYEALRELAVQAEAIAGNSAEVQELKENLTSYFTLMERANGLMAKLCQTTRVYFTEHIDSPHKRKVGPTRLSSRGRLSIYRGPRRTAVLPGPSPHTRNKPLRRQRRVQ